MVRMRAFQARDRGSIPRHRIVPVAKWIRRRPPEAEIARSSRVRDVSGAGLEVMTSALHAEGPEFDPRAPYFVLLSSESHRL